jgi:hemoglobin
LTLAGLETGLPRQRDPGAVRGADRRPTPLSNCGERFSMLSGIHNTTLEDIMDLESRRAQATAEIVERTGIDEAMIERLVRAFYDRARADLVLGPIFEARIDDWDLHLGRMFAFWSSVALMSGRYHGQPMEKHMPLPIDAGHFDRWLELFERTARDVCPANATAHFVERARRIAESLELGIAGRAGVLLKKGERYRAAPAGCGVAPC